MIGYKAFEHDMKCMNFQYKENEEYIHKGYFELCEAGFHFCLKLEDCFLYYPKYDCVIHRVEVPNYIEYFNEPDGKKWVTNKIRILERVYDSHKDNSFITLVYFYIVDKIVERFLILR